MAFLISPQTPGPGTYKVIDPNIYKNRKPIFSMNARNYAPGDSTLKPGPGAHRPEMVTIRILNPVNHCFDASSIILKTEVVNAKFQRQVVIYESSLKWIPFQYGWIIHLKLNS